MTATPVRTGSRARTTVRREPMGTLADGRAVEKVILANANGISATVMTLGASLQSLHLPDRNGVLADVVLGHDTPEEYLVRRSYLGASVGRYANRIAHGRFALDGREYRLDTNDGPHHLHGGDTGFDQKLWTIRTVSEGDAAGVELELVSPDGEGGYPGTLRATASYTLDDSNRLCIVYRATTDAPTPRLKRATSAAPDGWVIRRCKGFAHDGSAPRMSPEMARAATTEVAMPHFS